MQLVHHSSRFLTGGCLVFFKVRRRIVQHPHQAFAGPCVFWILAAAKLKEMGQKKLTLEEKKIRRRALKDRNLPSFQQHIQEQ